MMPQLQVVFIDGFIARHATTDPDDRVHDPRTKGLKMDLAGCPCLAADYG